MAESGSNGLEMPTDDCNNGDTDNKRSEFQWSVFVGRLFFASRWTFYCYLTKSAKQACHLGTLTPLFTDVET